MHNWAQNAPAAAQQHQGVTTALSVVTAVTSRQVASTDLAVDVRFNGVGLRFDGVDRRLDNLDRHVQTLFRDRYCARSWATRYGTSAVRLMTVDVRATSCVAVIASSTRCRSAWSFATIRHSTSP